MAQRPPGLANKSRAMRLSITDSSNELRVMYILCRLQMILLITPARVNVRFLTVFSICITPSVGSTALIVHINNESVILLGRVPEKSKVASFLELVLELEFQALMMYRVRVPMCRKVSEYYSQSI